MNRIVSFSLVAAIFALFCIVPAFGQGGTGELTGLVTDPTGAVVPNAPITLTNSATGVKHTTVSTNAGTYRFAALPVVGTYTLDAAPSGFKKVVVANIVISVGTITNHDIQLEVGTSSETVSVEAGQQLVQTTDSSVSQLVGRETWQLAPLEVRDQNAFVTLNAGAVQGNIALSAANGGTNRGAAVNGTRSGTGNYLVEGIDNNDQGQGGAGSIGVGTSGANSTISPDAIQEYRVIEHNFSAEYGKAGGFVVDTALRSGTNQWHGSAFEYNRVQALAANNFFSDRNGVKDSLVRNQFGGSFGGPIIKDKTFFFFSTEFHRLRTSPPLTGTVMTPDFLNFVDTGAFETFMESDPGGICNNQSYWDGLFGPGAVTASPCPGTFSDAATLGPIFKNKLLPQGVPLCVPGAANCSNLSNDSGGLFTSVNGFGPQITYPVPIFGLVTESNPTSLDQTRYTAKIDQKLPGNDSLNGTFIYDNGDFLSKWDGGDSTFGPSFPNHARAMNAGINWNHTFTPNVLNQARIGYVRHTSNFPGDPKSNAGGVPSVVTAFDPYNGAYGNSSALPQFFTENQFQYKDDLSITHGKHNFKTGAEYRRTRNGSSFETQFNGFFLPYGVEDLVTDMQFGTDADNAVFGGPAYGSWYYAQASIDPTKTPATRPIYYRGFRANEVGLYLQDDWRATSRLTLNLGLRWDYFGPPHNFIPGLDSNLFQGSPAVPFATTSTNPFFPSNSPEFALWGTSTFQVRNHEIWNKDTNNFAPRVGFAWDAMGNQKFVVRGGFGIAYDRMYNNIFENMRFNPPFYEVSTFGTFPNGVPGSLQETPGIYTVPFTSFGQFNNPALFPTGLPQPNPRAIDQNLVTAYYEQSHFGFQYQLGKDFVLETDYVGTWGRKLLGISNMNTFDGRVALGATGSCSTNPDVCRPNPNVGNINLRTNGFSSNYNAGQVTLTKRFTSGLQFNANYTYSKALDTISDAFTPRSQSLNPTDSSAIFLDYGPADFNVTHRFVFSYTYELPVFKGNRWIGGWSTSGIVNVQTGVPFSLYSSSSSGDANKNGTNNDRLAFVGSGSVKDAITGNSPAGTDVGGVLSNPYFNTSDFGRLRSVTQSLGATDVHCPLSMNSGLWCEGPAVGQTNRNTLVGPGYTNIDFSLGKKFKISEATALQFQANFFNILNHPNFAIPSGNFASGDYGFSTATVGDPRVIQLALRFDF